MSKTKNLKKLVGMVLAIAMSLCLAVVAFSDTLTVSAASTTGSITITNATIDETYHVYCLFTATLGDSGETAYVATAAQKAELEAADDNVFDFTELSDGSYQVTVKDGVSDEAVVSFVKSYVRTLGTVTACYFPGAVEETGSGNIGISDSVATASTVVFNDLPLGYYFVTSSLGSVVSLTTTSPNAEIIDKNTSEPDWDNNPDEPDEPVKDVVDPDSQRSINKEKVSVDDTLEYQISYTNTADEILSEVVVYDATPEGTSYVNGSIDLKVLDSSLNEVTIVEGLPASADENDGTTIYYALDETDDDNLTWTIYNLPEGATLIASFQVTVTTDALQIEDKTVVNDADLTVTLGENKYNLKTNTVENPVGEEGEPEKDVKAGSDTAANDIYEGSIDGNTVSVGDILTYTITYKNIDTDPVDLTIEDAPPAGTVYVAGSAASSLEDQTTIDVNEDGSITWEVDDLASDASVTVYFQVTVTDEALTITNSTIKNSADYSFDGTNFYKTNTVKNPTGEPDEPEEEDFGKVIVNADGTETKVSTGAFGDTVKFDVSIDAVNQVANDAGADSNGDGIVDPVQVSTYYIYDRMDPGFTLDADSFEITINGKAYEVTKDTDQSHTMTTYTIKISDTLSGSLYTYVDENGYTYIEATIPWVDADKNALYPNCEIHLTYTATINTNAEIAGDGNVNKAIYDYSTVDNSDPKKPDPDDPKYPSGSDLNHETNELTTVTYTYALGIQKISEETGEALAGAIFSAVDAGKNPIYAVPVTDDSGNVLYYNYTSDSTATGATASFESNADGQIIIKGVDIGTYSFTEVTAPSGYVLLTNPVELTAKMDSTTETYSSTTISTSRYFEAVTADEWSTYTDDVYTKVADGNFSIASKPDEYTDGYYKLVSLDEKTESAEVETTTYTFDVAVASVLITNAAGSTLPSTGGIGTTIFYIVGTILVLGAAVLLITKKRMSKAE